MAKWALFLGTLSAGILLAVFGYKAFVAAGVIVGVTAFCVGAYLMFWCGARRGMPMCVSIVLMAGGLLLIVLAIFVQPVAYFLGGILFAAAGVALMPLARYNTNIILPFNIGCVVLGLIIVFTPLFVGWLAPLIGVLLILYSIALIIFL